MVPLKAHIGLVVYSYACVNIHDPQYAVEREESPFSPERVRYTDTDLWLLEDDNPEVNPYSIDIEIYGSPGNHPYIPWANCEIFRIEKQVADLSPIVKSPF